MTREISVEEFARCNPHFALRSLAPIKFETISLNNKVIYPYGGREDVIDIPASQKIGWNYTFIDIFGLQE